jgi:hypothetical protein
VLLVQAGCITPLLAAMTNFVQHRLLQRNALNAMDYLSYNGMPSFPTDSCLDV